MNIFITKNAGFCFGVKRAINIAFKAAAEDKNGTYTLGPIIHNPQVVQKLADEGVKEIEDINQGNIRSIIIRSHGVRPEVYSDIKTKGYRIIDATCPFVKNAQRHADILKKEGYQVIIIGDKEHPEVKSILGYAGSKAIVVGSVEALQSVKLRKKVGIVAQTTQHYGNVVSIVRECLKTVRELRVFNTICDSTHVRQEATKELAKKVDVMIVVGGRCSANTGRLAEIAREIGTETYHIEVPDELREEWFDGIENVGVTGGASTPDWAINAVIERIKEINKRR
ncbi:MAG: 4-hydroxy-3-methylbut-2-enyl diphosphate reductase [Nitrospirota bacterium]